MISLRYHRQHLWIFFYMFFGLAALALIMDCVKANGQQNGKLPRFLWVSVCFLFAGIGSLIQYHGSRRFLGIEEFYKNRKKWKSKFVKLRKRNFKKTVKKGKVFRLILINMFSNLFSYLPFIVIIILSICNQWDNGNGIRNKLDFKKAFFYSAILIKHASLYINLLSVRFTLFFRKQRLNII